MNAESKRILVLTYTPIANEPRALKQIRYLHGAHEVVTAGFGPAPYNDVKHHEIPKLATLRWGAIGQLLGAALLLFRLYRPFRLLNALNPIALRALSHTNWDVVIAHDLKTLDLALDLKPRHGVILDLHEYAPRQEEHRFLWRLLIAPYYRWVCRTTVPKSAAVVTVSQGIADEYARQFGISSTVVVNATPFAPLSVTPVASPLRLVHSGGVAAQRRLDIMITGVRESTANITLDLYLVGEQSGLLAELKSLAADDARIRFREPVPYSELITTLNDYDVGLSIFPPTTFNLAWCLPNKFFDYIQARLGVIVGPSPEMERFVEKHRNGHVLADFEPSTLARHLESLTTKRVSEWKHASDANAEKLSSESQASIWDEIITGVTTSDRDLG